MIHMIIHWVLIAAVLLLIANIMPGIHIASFTAALWATLAIGLINLTVRPLVNLFTLPVNVLTLGLFSLVVNAAMFALAAWFVPGFEVSNFWSALVGAILLAVLSAVIDSLEANFSRA